MIAEHVARWTWHHGQQRRFSESIHRMADRLPVYDVEAIGELARGLVDIFDYEEKALFPLLERMSPSIAPLLETYRRHHSHDRDEISAIAQCLDPADRTTVDMDVLRFRMQALAEGMMRHVEFEEAICRALFASKASAAQRSVQ